MYGKLSHRISFPLFWRGGRKGSRKLGRPGLTLGSWGQARVRYENPAAIREGSGLENKRLHTHTHNDTHTFDNHTHRTGVPRLGRGPNHREPTPLSLASRCGSVGPLLCPGESTATSSLQGHDRRGEVDPKKRYEFPWGDLATSTLRRADVPRRRRRRRQPRAH